MEPRQRPGAPDPGCGDGRDADQFRPDFYPRTVLALEQRPRAGSPTWYRVSVPGRPNGRTGWIPAASVDLRPVDRWLVVSRESRRFELHVGRTVVRRGPVAMGARGMETPLGLFYVQAAFRPKRYPVLGAFAFETSGYSKAVGLARGRCPRSPRYEHAVADRAGGLARLRPPAKRGHPLSPYARRAGSPGQDRPRVGLRELRAAAQRRRTAGSRHSRVCAAVLPRDGVDARSSHDRGR